MVAPFSGRKGLGTTMDQELKATLSRIAEALDRLGSEIVHVGLFDHAASFRALLPAADDRFVPPFDIYRR